MASREVMEMQMEMHLQTSSQAMASTKRLGEGLAARWVWVLGMIICITRWVQVRPLV